MHLVEERNHLDDDNDAHDELNDAGDEEQHTRLCERGVSEGIGVYVSTAWGGGRGEACVSPLLESDSCVHWVGGSG